jgi:23S rRNA (cytidine2498-2'-O)-methyltransferase
VRPLFTRARPAALPVPAAVAFSAPAFRAESWAEIRRADPRARLLADPVAPAQVEAFAFALERPADEIAREIRRWATFTRHVQPIASAEEVGEVAAIARALGRAREAARPARTDLVGLPRALARRVLRESAPAGEAPGGGPLLSALVAAGRLYLGLSRVEDAPSPWPGGDPGHPIERVSRAASKLREALALLEAPLPPRISALDLGAAPGGFTSVLLERGARVLATDPAPLARALADAPGLRFCRGYAQDLDLALVPALDLITCDVVTRPSEVARLLARFAPRLAPGGAAIVTLKLRSRPGAEEQLRGAAALFAPDFELLRTRHLFANRREVTAFLRRAGDPCAARIPR